MTDSNNRETVKCLLFFIIFGAGIFLVASAINSNGARIHLVGKVTDMNNRELEDVTLDLDFSRPKRFWSQI
jgi:hypothetical protein